MITTDNYIGACERVVIKTERRAYVFWGIVGVCIIVVGALNTSNSSTFWYGAALFLLAWVIFLLWLASYKIVIDGDILSYSEFSKGTVAVNREDILSAEIRGRFQNMLVIKRRLGEPIMLNAKPFSKADLRVVIGFLADKIARKPDWI